MWVLGNRTGTCSGGDNGNVVRLTFQYQGSLGHFCEQPRRLPDNPSVGVLAVAVPAVSGRGGQRGCQEGGCRLGVNGRGWQEG